VTSLSGSIKRTRVGAPATGFLDRSAASANDTRRHARVATTGLFPSPLREMEDEN